MEQELAAHQETWKNNSDLLFALLRPELPSTLTLESGLKALYQDCYQTLLIGRYNASIVMMGVLLEALIGVNFSQILLLNFALNWKSGESLANDRSLISMRQTCRKRKNFGFEVGSWRVSSVFLRGSRYFFVGFLGHSFSPLFNSGFLVGLVRRASEHC
jgi:hypothetical protein